MFAEASQFQEEISVGGRQEKLKPKSSARSVLARGSRAVTCSRTCYIKAPRQQTIRPLPVDLALLKAGDHNGATFYQHQQFAELVRYGGKPAVSLEDGLKAVDIGIAAQRSAETGQTVYL